jgi:hypothetical protein
MVGFEMTDGGIFSDDDSRSDPTGSSQSLEDLLYGLARLVGILV